MFDTDFPESAKYGASVLDQSPSVEVPKYRPCAFANRLRPRRPEGLAEAEAEVVVVVVVVVVVNFTVVVAGLVVVEGLAVVEVEVVFVVVLVAGRPEEVRIRYLTCYIFPPTATHTGSNMGCYRHK